MAVIPIIADPNPTLRKKSAVVKKVDSTVEKTVRNLIDTLNVAKDPEGIGISASQIGVPEKICVVRKFEPDPEDPEKELFTDVVLINPKIIKSSKEKSFGLEGCLSVPDIYGQVERPKKIRVKALNEKGAPLQINASGFFARVIQHEIDHLNGILFTDKMIGKPLNLTELEKVSAL